MPEGKRYWKSLPERDGDPDFLEAAANEFPKPPADSGLNRRDFLLAAGFAVAGAVLPGCSRAPVQNAVPLATQPEGITPGRPLYYASTCGGCPAGCGLLVKTRDGRPIKLEGNPDHPLSQGGLCAVGQASLLGLYDSLRLRHPLKNGQEATWDEVDRDIVRHLDGLHARGAVRVLSGTITSPTLDFILQTFVNTFADGRHVVYDPLSSSAILDAHQRTHGVRALPRYHLDRAQVIVSFDADFLGTWIAPVEHTAGYRAGRSLEGNSPRCSCHVQFESRLSLTGAKADQRFRLAPSELGLVMTYLAHRIDREKNPNDPPWNSATLETLPVPRPTLDDLARKLREAAGKSLVLCGSQDLPLQLLCNYLNELLGNYRTTIDLAQPSYQRQGNDGDLQNLLDEVHHGRVAALFLLDCNPVFNLPGGQTLAEALERGRVPLVVTCGERLDETARVRPTQGTHYVCPHPHFLASWSDAEPVSGLVSLSQPTFPPLGHTRPILESLAAWMGDPYPAFYLHQEYWEKFVYPRHTGGGSFQAFWDQAVHDGFVEVTPLPSSPGRFNRGEVQPIGRVQPIAYGSFALVLYPKIGLLDGSHAYNPWLQELPDPVTKVTWDNYACLSPAAAGRLHLSDGDVVRLEAEGIALELPVLLQPGQHDQVVAVALGYGSTLSERFAHIGPRWLEARPSVGDNGLVGVNAAPLLRLADNALQYQRPVRITKTERRHPLASTQMHHAIGRPAHMVPPGRQPLPVIQETTVTGLAAAPPRHPPAHPDLWPADHDTPRHRWAMVIDLNACTGCSACVIACQAENNIPVVGKDEVRRQREMHWLRIDRYYTERQESVDVAFQPMLCQHCGNAPCETVCPVLATLHSSEGLNQQVYNRCVGTRYCANNCPYKVRRFNWFLYPRDDPVQNLVLNPDVTVRSRGVMEKCSFCVQRIAEAKIETRRNGEGMFDGAVLTACQQSCPAQAIRFGDQSDPHSQVAQAQSDPRRYRVLEELNVQPAVSYLKLVRNR